jgi:hypothetical protein
MTNELRESMMPAFDRLINSLSEVLKASNLAELNLWRLETLVMKLLAAFAVELLQILIELAHGQGYEGSRHKCPQCGSMMKFERYQQRHLTTLFGEMRYVRAYYHCRPCRSGYCGVDERLGLGSRAVSPRLDRLVSFLGAHLSFGVVEKALRESHELEMNREVVRQLAEGSGERAREWERQQETEAEQDLTVLTGRSRKTWIIECDGKMVGWQDGSWHEVKVGVIYELSQRVETSRGRQELVKRELVARRCGWQEFARLFWSAMRRAGVGEGDLIIALADGAEAMEQIFSFVAPEAVRIRDFYHVAEKIHAIGELRFGTASKVGGQWTSAQLHKLKQSQTDTVMRSIAHLKLPAEEAREARRQILNYLEKNRHATDYARYEQEGWPLGSGAVEGGCRLIGARTNGCGRRWRARGCDAIIALRVAVLNERMDVLLPVTQQAHQIAA